MKQRALILFIFSMLSVTAFAASPMERAAERGDVAEIRTQLGAGVDINQKFDIGRSALMIAARYGKLSAVEALSQAGADLNLQDNNGDTALHLAAAYAHKQVVEFLLNHGANTQIQNRSKRTVLQHVQSLSGRYGSDPDLVAMSTYLAKLIPTLPQTRSNTTTTGTKPTASTSIGEPALFVDYLTVDVKKYNSTPAELQRAAKAALLQRGWTIIKSEPQQVVGSYTRSSIEYRVQILMLSNQSVRIAFLNGYHDTRPNYLRNLEKDLLLELELIAARR